jgi:hypothetical protein
MKAICLNCTLKRSPQESNTDSLSEVVMAALREEGVETDSIRLVDHRIEPGVVSDGAHHCISEISGALIDIGYTIPAQAWTYWNKGPGPGDEQWLTTDEREWSITTGQTAARNLLAVARALQAHPIPPPQS